MSTDARRKTGHDVEYNYSMIARERADRLLVARGLFESRARAQAAIAAGLVTADGVLVRKAVGCDLYRCRDRGRARASLCLAWRAQACGGPRPFSSRRHGPRLPRCRRLDRGFHRITDGARRPAGLRNRRRQRPASLPLARAEQHRLDGANRYPNARSVAARRAARPCRSRRELHLAQARSAGDRQASAAARGRSSR